METVKDFWENQAIKHVEDYKATNPDYYSFVREIQTLQKHLNPTDHILEYGCGNGYASQQIFETHDFPSYLGVDYSENMIKVAIAGSTAPLERRRYEVGDVMIHKTDRKYDTVFTDRCLINLANHDEQVMAMKNIYDNLRPGGTYLMMECSKKSLGNINKVRTDIGLSEITERWHNYYLEEDRLLEDIDNYFSLEEVDSFASTYFLISRTVNAVVGEETGNIDYRSTVNRVASTLPPQGDYAPLKLFVLKRRE